MSTPCIARCLASGPIGHGFTRTSSLAPKFFMARATAPTFPSFFGSTRTTRMVGTPARYIVMEIFLGMRVALKIAYDGGAFFGHQRQPDRRTVEGECLAALRAGKVVQDPLESFFRSASRTDRGVSAVGNVIAFDSALRPDAVVGVFNNHAQGVWAWACSDVPPTFHPRHAIERWYRYHLYGDLRVDSLREVGAVFLGDRDFRSFTSEPLAGPFALNRLEVRRDRDAIVVDVRAGSFRRGMVRR